MKIYEYTKPASLLLKTMRLLLSVVDCATTACNDDAWKVVGEVVAALRLEGGRAL